MAAPITSLFDALSQIDDPRKARGVRHPYTSLLALTFLGLLCRQTDMAGLQRWAKDHWQTLKGPLGFTRKKPPHATTISRAAAKFSLGQFRDAFARWVRSLPRAPEAVTVAVDGKTSKQGHDADGEPIHMLNVFAHELNLCLAQFPVTGGKPTEPQALKHGLKELLDHYPFIRLFTADALFTQRPLARVILGGRPRLPVRRQGQPAGPAGGDPDQPGRRRRPRARREVRRKKGDELHTRRLWVVEGDEVAYAREATGFPGIGMILRIDTEVTKAGAPGPPGGPLPDHQPGRRRGEPEAADGPGTGPLGGRERAAFHQGPVVGRGPPVEPPAGTGGAVGDAAGHGVRGLTADPRASPRTSRSVPAPIT